MQHPPGDVVIAAVGFVATDQGAEWLLVVLVLDFEQLRMGGPLHLLCLLVICWVALHQQQALLSEVMIPVPPAKALFARN